LQWRRYRQKRGYPIRRRAELELGVDKEVNTLIAFRKSRRPQQVVLAAALVLGMAGSLAACSGQPASDEAQTITIWSWTGPTDALKSVVPDFEAKYPNVTVDVQDVGNPAIWDKITTGMAAGGDGLPDIMQIGGDYMSTYLEKFPDGLVNLSSEGIDQYADSFPAGSWAGAATADGQVYGVPADATSSMFFYNTALFDAAGVDYTTIETWEDLIAAGLKVKDATGAQLLGIDKSATVADSANTWQEFTQFQGSGYFNAAGEITLNSPEAVRSLTLLKETNDAGLLADVPGDVSKIFAAFGEQKIATMVSASWVAGALPGTLPDLSGKVKMAEVPSVAPGAATAAAVGSSYLTIASSSKHRDAALDFIEFALTDLGSQQTIFDASGFFPAFKPMWETDGFVEASDYYGGQEPNSVIIDALSQPTAAFTWTSDYARALRLYDNAQTQVLVSGADPQQALDDAAQQLASQTGRPLAG
jgi:lactose/L-arabinose transport system substrate-binding protein